MFGNVINVIKMCILSHHLALGVEDVIAVEEKEAPSILMDKTDRLTFCIIGIGTLRDKSSVIKKYAE